MPLGLDLSNFDLEGVDPNSLNLDDVDPALLAPIKTSMAQNNNEASKTVGLYDMCALNRLDEKTVMKNLQDRFAKDITYTYIGSVLVSVNPFKAIPGLYENPKRYQGKALGELPPHVYAIADKAYSLLMSQNRDQSFIISGESGAGKTETMKQILNYLAIISPAQEQAPGRVPIHEKVMQANPVLESFGNAKTIHNRNSSRFGKFIEIQLDAMGSMLGTRICDYLLEKTRLVFQSEDERNYHVFYQLIAGAPQALKQKVFIDGKSARDFRYLTGGACTTVENMDDAKEFRELHEALKLFFSDILIEGIFTILGAILHLGNVDFQGTDNIRGFTNITPVEQAATLMGVKTAELTELLTVKVTHVKGEVIKSSLRKEDALSTRDTLVKALYSRMFKWIVQKLNVDLCHNEPSRFCGLLDIFGFEVFKNNDLEQLCINYANEQLQDYFNEYIFRLEQLEYKAEDLKVKAVTYVDNKPCLEMIATKLGVFGILDDQCNTPAATATTLVHYVDEGLKKHANYSKDKKTHNGFTIKHYAGKVTYDVSNWITKNKESTPQEMDDCVRNSTNVLLQTIFAEHGAGGSEGGSEEAPVRRPSLSNKTLGPARAGAKKKAPSVTGQFKRSLEELMLTLKRTNPFFIRCLKPNAEQVPNRFNVDYITNQMRSVGMVDTIKIRQSGYPVRYVYKEFFERYLIMLPSDQRQALLDKKPEDRQLAQWIMQYIGVEEEDYAIGKTKIFVKDRPADLMENRLATIQKTRLRKVRREIGRQQREKEESVAEVAAMKLKEGEQGGAVTTDTEDEAQKVETRHPSATSEVPTSPLAKVPEPEPEVPSSASSQPASMPPPEMAPTPTPTPVTEAPVQPQSRRRSSMLPPPMEGGIRRGTVVAAAPIQDMADVSAQAMDPRRNRMTLRRPRESEGSKLSKYAGALKKKVMPGDSQSGSTAHAVPVGTVIPLAPSVSMDDVKPNLGDEIWENPHAQVEIRVLFISSMGETKRVPFVGVRNDAEIQRAFRHTFPTHQYPSPFPKIYITDPVYRVQYELQDYTEIREGSLLTCKLGEGNMSSRLDEISSKLDRSMDVMKDHLRLVLQGGMPGPMPAQPMLKTGAPQPTAGAAKRVVGSGITNKESREVLQKKVADARHQTAVLRRDIAIVKQAFRDQHDDFQAQLKASMAELVSKLQTAITPTQFQRSQLKHNQENIVQDEKTLQEDLKDLKATLETATRDVVKRKIRPSKAQVEYMRGRLHELEGKVNTISALFDDSKAGFKKVWTVELQQVVNDEKFINEHEEHVGDIEEQFDDVAKAFDDLDEVLVTRDQLGPEVPVLDTSLDGDVSIEDVVDNVLDDIVYLKVDNAGRLKKIEEAEALRRKQKELERLEDPLVKFQRDLGSKMGGLKKTGGVQEIERMRQRKDAETLGIVGVVS